MKPEGVAEADYQASIRKARAALEAFPESGPIHFTDGNGHDWSLDASDLPTDTLESLSAELDALPPASQTAYATDAAVERHTAFVRRVAAVVRTEVGNDRIAVGYRLLERAQYIPWGRWNREEDESFE